MEGTRFFVLQEVWQRWEMYEGHDFDKWLHDEIQLEYKRLKKE